MELGELASRIEGAGYGPIKWGRNNTEFKFRCCCHDERTPSATFKLGTGGKLIGYCFGCGAKGDKMAEALGLDPKDLFPPKINGNGYQKPATSTGPRQSTLAAPARQALPAAPPKPLLDPKSTPYRIRDAEGALVAVHMRIDGLDPDTKARKKIVWWEMPDGSKGTGGRSTSDFPFFGAHLLAEAPDDEWPVVVEGEKAAAALIKRKLPAVGTVCGAAAIPCDATLSTLLRFPVVTLWPDNDPVGQKHMNRIAEALIRLGHQDVRMMAPVGEVGSGADAADLADDVKVSALLDAAEKYSPASTALTNKESTDVGLVIPWETHETALQADAAYLDRMAVVDRLCYASAISMITGGKHAGKSTLARWLAICVAKGIPFLGREVNQGRVFYIASEDETMAARKELLRLGWAPGDPIQFLPASDIPYDEPKDFLPVLTEQVRDSGAVLVILDMLFDFVRIRDEMGYAETREAVGYIQRVASGAKSHVVVVHHAPKHATQTAEAAVQALGSQGLAARVSPIILVRRLGPKIHNITSTDVRDPRGEAIPLSRLNLAQDGSLQLGGQWKDYMQAEIYKPQILEILGAEPGQELTAKDLSDQLEVSYRTAAAACSELYREGAISRAGSGQRGKPYRYSLFPNAETKSSSSNEIEKGEAPRKLLSDEASYPQPANLFENKSNL